MHLSSSHGEENDTDVGLNVVIALVTSVRVIELIQMCGAGMLMKAQARVKGVEISGWYSGDMSASP